MLRPTVSRSGSSNAESARRWAVLNRNKSVFPRAIVLPQPPTQGTVRACLLLTVYRSGLPSRSSLTTAVGNDKRDSRTFCSKSLLRGSLRNSGPNYRLRAAPCRGLPRKRPCLGVSPSSRSPNQMAFPPLDRALATQEGSRGFVTSTTLCGVNLHRTAAVL